MLHNITHLHVICHVICYKSFKSSIYNISHVKLHKWSDSKNQLCKEGLNTTSRPYKKGRQHIK